MPADTLPAGPGMVRVSGGGAVFAVPVKGQKIIMKTGAVAKLPGHNEFILQPGSYSALNMPQGFAWDWADINIYINFVQGRTDLTKFYTDLDIETYKITGKTYYVNCTSGNDSNDGLTSVNPLAHISTALAKSDVDIISLSPGVYPRNNVDGNGLGNIIKLIPTRNISLVCPDGRAVLSMRSVFTTWTHHATYTNVYYVSRSLIGRVFDSSNLDSNGDYNELTLKTSIADVNTTENSWFTDGTNVYVHKQNGAAPGAEMCLYYNNAGMDIIYNSNGVNLYLKNLDFEGGDTPLYNSAGGELYINNCTFKYSTVGNGLSCLGTKSILNECVAAKNRLDGFNYHEIAATHTGCRAIEINCIGRDNGYLSEAASSNGSTSHELSQIIRIDGEYMRNHGPNVADVLGAQSWNLNVYSHDSTCTDGSNSDADFYLRDSYLSNNAKMFLDSCFVTGSRSFYPIYAGANCNIYKLDTLTPGDPDLLPGYIEITDTDTALNLTNLAGTVQAKYFNKTSMVKNSECDTRTAVVHGPSSALVPCAPYTGLMPYDSPALGVDTDLINLGNTTKIRQTGNIKKVKFAVASVTGLTDFRIKIWRSGDSNYTAVATSENLASRISAGVNEITLNTPLAAVTGDYYGIYVNAAAANILQTESITAGVVKTTTGNNAAFAWDSSGASSSGVQFTVYLYMDSPEFVFIGDSTTAGAPHTSTFLVFSPVFYDKVADPAFGCCGNLYSYQNMAIPGQDSALIRARFLSDVVALHPRYAVIETGLNNNMISTTETQNFIIADVQYMINACIENNIIPVIYEVPPATSDTAELAAGRNIVNAAIKNMLNTYNFIIFDNRNVMGVQDSETGKWSIKSEYDYDGTHYTRAGYGVLGAALGAFLFNSVTTIKDIKIKNEGASSASVNLAVRTNTILDTCKLYKLSNNEYVLDSSVSFSDSVYSTGAATGKTFSVTVPAGSSVQIKLEIISPPGAAGSYLLGASALANLAAPWLALLDSSGACEYYIFTGRPASIQYIKNVEGVISEIRINPGNNQVFRGVTWLPDQLTDTDADNIPDCLESLLMPALSGWDFNS